MVVSGPDRGRRRLPLPRRRERRRAARARRAGAARLPRQHLVLCGGLSHRRIHLRSLLRSARRRRRAACTRPSYAPKCAAASGTARPPAAPAPRGTPGRTATSVRRATPTSRSVSRPRATPTRAALTRTATAAAANSASAPPPRPPARPPAIPGLFRVRTIDLPWEIPMTVPPGAGSGYEMAGAGLLLRHGLRWRGLRPLRGRLHRLPGAELPRGVGTRKNPSAAPHLRNASRYPVRWWSPAAAARRTAWTTPASPTPAPAMAPAASTC
jgi:hypothetical protein